MAEISMMSLTPPKEILRGSVLGDAHAADFANRIEALNLAGDRVVVLDFEKVEAATASYLKRFFSPLLAPEFMGAEGNIFPLITRACDDLRDDLHSFLSDKGWVVSEVNKRGKDLSFVRLLGRPESATEKTFDLLRGLGQASAGSLFDGSEDKSINQTAWNNRLSTLLKLRLATRRKQGRNWIYQPTF